MEDRIGFYKEGELPAQVKNNSLYFIKAEGSLYTSLYVTTDDGGIIPVLNRNELVTLIGELVGPGGFKVVDDITERDQLDTSAGVNFLVLVIDATGDPTVEVGSALYAWYNSEQEYVKLAEYESLDFEVKTSDDVKAMESIGALVRGGVVSAGTTLQGVVEKLLTAVYYPQFVNPTVVLQCSFQGLEEIGKTENLVLSAVFDRGEIKGVLQEGLWESALKQDNRSGEVLKYIIGGQDMLLVSSRQINNYVVVGGVNSFDVTVQFGVGPQPLDSKGENYSEPLSAGDVEGGVQFVGVYPYFATTVNIGTLTKQPLALMDSAYVEVQFVAEDESNKQSIDFPEAWGVLSGVQWFNTLSGQWEWVGGVKGDSLGTFTETSVTHTVQGVVVNYKRYVHGGGRVGRRILRFTVG